MAEAAVEAASVVAALVLDLKSLPPMVLGWPSVAEADVMDAVVERSPIVMILLAATVVLESSEAAVVVAALVLVLESPPPPTVMG